MGMMTTSGMKWILGWLITNSMKKLFLIFLGIYLISVSALRADNPIKGYKSFVDVTIGDAYNLNTAQTVSTNNLQWYSMVSTTHGYRFYNWFVGAGIGYYHSYRDKENMFPAYLAGKYTYEKAPGVKPYIEAQVGIMYDRLWIEKVLKYGSLGAGINVYKGLQLGLRVSLFSRPSRFFTANAAIVLSNAFGK